MRNPEHWQTCEATDHVGPERDATVEWRDLGLMCDTCFSALADTRPLRQQLDGAVRLLERARIWVEAEDERGYSREAHELLAEIDSLLGAVRIRDAGVTHDQA